LIEAHIIENSDKATLPDMDSESDPLLDAVIDDLIGDSTDDEPEVTNTISSDDRFEKIPPVIQFGILYPDLNMEMHEIRKLVSIARNNNYLIRECKCKYRIISRSETMNIFSFPSKSSFMKKKVYYGDVYDTIGLVFGSSDRGELNWIFVKYGDTQGFINLTRNDIELVKSKNSSKENTNDDESIRNLPEILSISFESNDADDNESIRNLPEIFGIQSEYNDNDTNKYDIQYDVSVSDNRKTTEDKPHNECSVCFNGIIQKIALVSCGHTRFCEDCIKRLTKNNCPICTQKFTSYIKLFD